MTPADEKLPTLSYRTPKREKPIPLWKHFIFAPLLFWIGIFIVGALAATLFALVEIIRLALRH